MVNDVDDMLIVVRQNYCDRVILKDALKQFELVGAKIPGIVYNSTIEDTSKKKYYKNRYYSEAESSRKKQNRTSHSRQSTYVKYRDPSEYIGADEYVESDE